MFELDPGYISVVILGLISLGYLIGCLWPYEELSVLVYQRYRPWREAIRLLLSAPPTVTDQDLMGELQQMETSAQFWREIRNLIDPSGSDAQIWGQVTRLMRFEEEVAATLGVLDKADLLKQLKEELKRGRGATNTPDRKGT